MGGVAKQKQHFFYTKNRSWLNVNLTLCRMEMCVKNKGNHFRANFFTFKIFKLELYGMLRPFILDRTQVKILTTGHSMVFQFFLSRYLADFFEKNTVLSAMIILNCKDFWDQWLGVNF